MSELITRITPEGTFQYVRYTKDEIKAFWAKHPPSDDQRRFLRVPAVHEKMALELSAIWLRQYNADPSTFTYLPSTGEMYFYFKDLGERAAWQNQLRAYELVGADERGPLFADPDAREINPLPLLKVLQELRNSGQGSMINKVIDDAIAKAYGK